MAYYHRRCSACGYLCVEGGAESCLGGYYLCKGNSLDRSIHCGWGLLHHCGMVARMQWSWCYHYPLVCDIQSLLSEFVPYNIMHIWHETNSAMDWIVSFVAYYCGGDFLNDSSFADIFSRHFFSSFFLMYSFSCCMIYPFYKKKKKRFFGSQNKNGYRTVHIVKKTKTLNCAS